jgi:small subunit ribosomal protein S2
MPDIRELLKAGAHFGHQKQKWNPKMAPYIFTERNNIHIIDLQKSVELLEDAMKFVKQLGMHGEKIFLVGTKRQASEVIKEEAEKAEVPYVNYRWLGGMLTNFVTINQSVKKLKNFENILSGEKRGIYTKKELSDMEKKKIKLERNLSGIAKMDRMPAAIFIVDPRREHIAVNEARILGIPIIAIVDTNSDPDNIDFVIPANDDGMRSISIITSDIIDAYLEGYELYRQQKVTEEKDKKEKPSTMKKETRRVAGRKVKVKRIATTDGADEKEGSQDSEQEDEKKPVVKKTVKKAPVKKAANEEAVEKKEEEKPVEKTEE